MSDQASEVAPAAVRSAHLQLPNLEEGFLGVGVGSVEHVPHLGADACT